MFQILVVDDEPSALDYICHLIRMKCPELEIAATAENGKEGLKMFRQLSPDLVISDVKMPVMDGIEMIRAIKEENPGMPILLVSGYQDFEYVRAAFKYGVCDYVLKPLTPARFVAAIEPMLKALQQEVYNQRKQLVRSMIEGNALEETMVKRSFPEERYFVALIRDNGLPRRFAGNRKEELISEAMNTIFIYGRDDREALYICPERVIGIKGFSAMIQKEASRKQEEKHFTTTVLIGIPVQTHRLAPAVELLYRTLNSHLSVGVTQSLILKGVQERADENRAWDEAFSEKEILKTMEYYYKKQDYAAVLDQLWGLLIKAEAVRCPQLRLEHIIRQLVSMLQPIEERKNVFEDEILYEDAFYDANNIKELYESLKGIMVRYWKEEKEQVKMDSVEFLNGILEFIEEHLAEELTVSYVCHKFGLSQSYLNLIFRKNGIEPFSAYLRNVRIERAKKIMKQNPQVFIKDVASMTGYKDQFYFSRVFRAVTGLSPTEYIDNIS